MFSDWVNITDLRFYGIWFSSMRPRAVALFPSAIPTMVAILYFSNHGQAPVFGCLLRILLNTEAVTVHPHEIHQGEVAS